MNIFIDIETIPDQREGALEAAKEALVPPGNYSKPETIAAWREKEGEEAWRKTALDGSVGMIAAISIAIDNGPVDSFWSPALKTPLDLSPADWLLAEYDTLSRAFHYIKGAYTSDRDHTRPVFVGHNHVAFDLPFIYKRAVVHRTRPPASLPRHPKAWDQNVFDTMIEFAGVGRTIGMDRLCRALGIEGKAEGLDGSKVWDAIKEGRIEEVAGYCDGDVERTRSIYKRLTFQETAE